MSGRTLKSITVAGSVRPAAAGSSRTPSRLNVLSQKRVAEHRSAEAGELTRVVTQLFPNPGEAEQLLALQDNQGNPLLTLNDRASFLAVKALAREQGFAKTLEYLRTLGHIRQYNDNDPLLSEARSHDELRDELYLDPETVTENEYQCKKCTSRRVARSTKQTRSADEGASVFLRCTACGNRWGER